MISQDDVLLDLNTGELSFNGIPLDRERLERRVRGAYSIRVQAGLYSQQDGSPGVDDLFGPKQTSAERAWGAFPARRLAVALEPIAAAEIAPDLVRVSAVWSWDGVTEITDSLVLGPDGALTLNDQPVELSRLAGRVKGRTVSLVSRQRDQYVNYEHLLNAARALGPDVQIAELRFAGLGLVEVSAKIHTTDGDGGKDVLSAPKVTTLAGNEAIIRVVENGAGSTRLGVDAYQQEDLRNLGVRFFVEPRIIGDRVKVTGLVVITRVLDKEEVFREGEVPVYSYTIQKTVAPCSVLLAPGETSKEFKIADIDGKSGMCEVSATVVNSKGMPISPSR